MSDFRFPKPTQRTAIVGRTGSGKSQFGSWLLSQANFDRQPWVIVDYKYDDLLNNIPGIEEITLKTVPKKPGLYIVHPLPNDDDAMEDWLWRVWEKEKIGLHIDEGYMIPDKGAFNALLTQGRSKKIPMNILTQRPAWISRFVFSEADYFSIFHLNNKDDRKKVTDFTRIDPNAQLQEYHSHWYDVAKNKTFLMRPVPKRDIILESFENRLKPKRRFL